MQNPENSRSNNEKAQDKPKVVLLAGPIVSKLHPDCPIIGGVAYPPHLIRWDKAQEGDAAVRERLHRRNGIDHKCAKMKIVLWRRGSFGVCC
jgi:hypothetical protein